ncbi:TIGR04452 family lipoprotein [Leptospira andrefontaineae]|uniref:TIGR04452 family lipoprotein n=1 Tax=Leptospira andrefontaineae TaxID=2484976 RepID=A0A4R9H2V0_9LEPT|nr:TIGR04452 family lipoprotein [Leptospira andrefontaineae]TGK39032.1 TIGR04452 family lipoprotein [Leptospira andrefontaineae]
MKKIKIFILTLLYGFLLNCIIVDNLGLTDTYKGDVAKKRLLDAAMIGDSLTARAAFTAQGYTGPELESYIILDVIYVSLIDETVFKIDKSKYYKKDDIDDCAKALQIIGVIADFDSFTTYMSNFNCNLSANDLLIDKNMGKSSNNPSKNNK